MFKSKRIRSIYIFIILSLILFYFYDRKEITPIDYHYDVTIHRDIWGVPHIYGHRDRDAAFGLAYAHAEDDFRTIQDILLLIKGKLAEFNGKDSAPADYLVGLLRVWKTVEEKYDTDLSDEIKLVCNAYADGINYYIQKHPTEAILDLYPVTGRDIVAGFVLRTPLMFELDWYIKKLLEDTKPIFNTYANRNTEYMMYGSNTMAIAPSRSADGYTRITTNSHQPWEGPVTWYEAHIHSNEGWNMSGGLFPGSPVIFKGYNDNLAWSHTVNDPDFVDIYELTINPENENQYLMDGQWLNFEKELLPIKVKLLGPIKWTFNRELLWSLHGPVVKSKHGTYAIRYSGYGLVGQVEQWFKMNKASNLEDFKSAMQMMQVSMFNTLYADKTGNLFYLYNALLPVREEGYDWSGILPGDEEKLIWNSYHSFQDLPQSINPESGYLQNCNSTPYLATVGKGNPERVLPANTGIEDFQTNRAYRANELYGNDQSISREEFEEYKYDTYYSQNSVMKFALEKFLNDVDTNDPELLEGIKLLKNWDLGNQRNNRAAALAQLTFKLTYDITAFSYNYDQIFSRFKEAVSFLKDEFGRIDIQLGDLQILKRGELELPLDGGPDLLRAIYSKKREGKKVATAGDCFFQIIEWDTAGKVSARSIHQYGSATQDQKSVHYSDQAQLFSDMMMKPSFIELDSIKKYLKISYTP